MKPSRWPLVLALGAVLLALSAYHLFNARRGYQDYRDQHLGTALAYADGKIDLLRPVIVGFNANDEPYPLELPVWQATAAVFFKAFGHWHGWANVTSLLFFVAGLWPLYQLARRYLGDRGAWWTLLFFCAEPLVFLMAGRGGTDGSCEAFAIWFAYWAEALIRTGKWSNAVPAFIFGALSAVTKLPFFFCVGLASFFLLLQLGRASAVRWLQLGAVGLAVTATFFIWNHYCEQCYTRGEFSFGVAPGPEAKGTEAESSLAWYFGSWSYRLDPRNWLHGAWRFGGAVFGSFALGGFALWSLVCGRNRLAQFWLLGGFLTTLVFTHLVLHHHHYYLMFTPAIALLGGGAAARLEELAGAQNSARRLAWVGAATVLLLLSTFQGLTWLNAVLDTDPYPRRMAALIRQYTGENDKLLIQGGGWGGEELILSGRKGLSIWDTRFLEVPQNLARIRSLGYSRLVMISETPLLVAVQMTKPGQAGVTRDTYERKLTAVAREWKTIFQTDDILIKEIPRDDPPPKAVSGDSLPR